MKPLYIFDLDGTLSLTEHRLHYIQGKTKNWDAFFLASKDDGVNLPIATIFRALRQADREVWIVSGRSNIAQATTEQWLKDNNLAPDMLYLRDKRDHRNDYELKQAWYCNLPSEDANRIVCVFEDRTRVVQMWRSHSVACLQVTDGDF